MSERCADHSESESPWMCECTRRRLDAERIRYRTMERHAETLQAVRDRQELEIYELRKAMGEAPAFLRERPKPNDELTLRSYRIIERWLEWARMHGHLEHAEGIVQDSRELIVGERSLPAGDKP